MYEKLEKCPSCKHTLFSNHMICEDYLVSHESFALVKCSRCHLVFTNPRPEASSIGKYYASTEYQSHQKSSRSLFDLAYHTVRSITTKQKFKHIRQYQPSGRLLDYGCGMGYFLNKASKYQAYGFDRFVSPKSDKFTLLKNVSDIKKEEKFDVITAWHVVEHVHNLSETIKLLRKKLNDKGTMFIALPNLSSYDANYYKSNWAAYDVPRHLYHFNPNSFSFFLKKLKLQLIEVIPMKFDAYYVSMLSEKRLANGSLLNALKVGYKSNRLAQVDENFSSLIYVVTK